MPQFNFIHTCICLRRPHNSCSINPKEMSTMSMPFTAPNSFICSLDGLSGIQISGEQTNDYLQGQLTTNMQRLTDDQAQFACHCDFKGKMWNVGNLIKHGERVLYLGKADAIPTSLTELKKYGVFSKVDIEQLPDETEFYGLYGPDADVLLKDLTGSGTGEHGQVRAIDNGWVLTYKSVQFTRFLLCIEGGDSGLLQSLKALPEIAQSYWSAMQILDGIPSIAAQTSNEYVPQMLNLQALDAIDFNKGCYMGQEVVARTKYLGKNKRAMYVLSGDLPASNDSQTIAPGDTLEKSVGENWRRGGVVIDAAIVDGRVYTLAVLSNDSEMGSLLRLKSAPEISMSIQPLPYSIDE